MHHESTVQARLMARHSMVGLALLSLVAPLAGCVNSPRTQAPFDDLAELEPTSDVVPDERPSEAGFLSLVQTYCGPLLVGDMAIAERLRTDPTFLQLTKDLYHGNLTNDRYMRRLLKRHPAPDANIDAMGCVVNQMQKCYTERCSVPIAERPLPERDPPENLEVFDRRGSE